MGNNPTSKNLSQAVSFIAANNDTSPTASFKLDRIGAFVHSMTGGSIPKAAIHAVFGGEPGDKLFDLEPLYNDDGHIDYFVALRDAQALNGDTGYVVVFTEGGGSNASYKLYVTAKDTQDDNSHPKWPVGVVGQTKDNDATMPSWDEMRSGDSPTGTFVKAQIRIYAGVAP